MVVIFVKILYLPLIISFVKYNANQTAEKIIFLEKKNIGSGKLTRKFKSCMSIYPILRVNLPKVRVNLPHSLKTYGTVFFQRKYSCDYDGKFF
jgi:hypothetical protein